MRTVYKVKLVKCSRDYFWYNEMVGDEYLVVKSSCDNFDYSLVDGPVPDDVFLLPYECPLLVRDDFEIIDAIFDPRRKIKSVWG